MHELIHGIDVILYERTQNGTDGFNRPKWTETAVTVSNVLVAPAGYSQDLTDSTYLDADKTRYTLGIPKGDTHTWTGNRVEFFGRSFRVVGEPVKGIDRLIPLAWNRKVQVEAIG